VSSDLLLAAKRAPSHDGKGADVGSGASGGMTFKEALTGADTQAEGPQLTKPGPRL
jgi:hypothetical protein